MATIVDGTADVDESMITGESRAVAKEPGDRVDRGHRGRRRLAARPCHRRRRRDRPVRDHAAGGRGPGVGVASAGPRRSRRGAPVLRRPRRPGIVTLVVWWFMGDPEGALVRTATVLVIACPHALGLAIPLVIAISTSLGARNGLLVKDRLALERARELDLVIFDKTGTLTRGEPAVTGVLATDGTTEDDVVRLAAAVEADSEHPLARAIVRARRGSWTRGVAGRPGFEALDGSGRPGHGRWQGRRGRRTTAARGSRHRSSRRHGHAGLGRSRATVLHVVIDGQRRWGTRARGRHSARVGRGGQRASTRSGSASP